MLKRLRRRDTEERKAKLLEVLKLASNPRLRTRPALKERRGQNMSWKWLWFLACLLKRRSAEHTR